MDAPRATNNRFVQHPPPRLILFGLATRSAGAGYFSYNPATGETGKTPFLHVPGTIVDAGVFE
jgi:hypothetical protein